MYVCVGLCMRVCVCVCVHVSVSECLCVFQAAGDHNEMPTVHRISLYCVTPDNSEQKGTLRYYRGQLAWGRIDMGRNGERANRDVTALRTCRG